MKDGDGEWVGKGAAVATLMAAPVAASAALASIELPSSLALDLPTLQSGIPKVRISVSLSCFKFLRGFCCVRKAMLGLLYVSFMM